MKKKLEQTEEVVEKIVKDSKEELKDISPVTLDFGREDLNLLRDAVNELIKRS